MRVLYLAHDLDDTAIWRRVEMLRRAGADVVVAGFQRGEAPAPDGALVLGRTQNGRLVARAAQVARTLPTLRRRLEQAFGQDGVDVILARNLEMLLLARSLRAGPPVIYELLDIHRVMLREDAIGRAMRALERRLLRKVAQVWISSPGFEEQYLGPYGQGARDTLLVENKPLVQGDPPQDPPRLSLAEPGRITIAWPGILRCAWSLGVLDALTRAAPGRYRVVLRGRPARDAVPGFDSVVAVNPDLEFGGAYAWPDDLPQIYGQCDLAWLIDRFDAGRNSDWLLPNRLYEGALHGAVPIVLAGTQVARRAASENCGVIVDRPDLAAVTDTLGRLDAAGIAAQRERLAATPRAHWAASQEDCDRLVAALGRAAAGGGKVQTPAREGAS